MNKNGTPKRHRIMRLVAGLPLRVLYIVSDLAYPILYYIIRYRRRLVRENLRCSFPEKSEKEILHIEKKFYRNLCDVFIEAFKCLNISDDEMRRRVEVRNCELPERLAAEGRNIFMLLGHMGCWEWYQEVGERYTAPRRGCEIYRRQHNTYFDSLMHEIRSRWNTTQVEMNDTVRTLFHWEQEGEPFLAGFIQDQRITKHAPRHWTTFLNQPTDITPGAEELAYKLNAELVYLEVEKPRRGHYRITFREMNRDDAQTDQKYPMTCLFFLMLEDNIRRQPELWLWSHNRWRKWELL